MSDIDAKWKAYTGTDNLVMVGSGAKKG